MAEMRRHRRRRDKKSYITWDGEYDLHLSFKPDDKGFFDNHQLSCSVSINGKMIQSRLNIDGELKACCPIFYLFREKQEINIDVFRADTKKLGTATVTFGSLLGEGKGHAEFKIDEGTVIIQVTETPRSKGRLIITFGSSSYPTRHKNSFTNPFLVISKVQADGRIVPVYQTEANFARKPPHGLKWKPIFMSPWELGEGSDTLEIKMYHHSKDMIHGKPDFLADARVKLASFLRNAPMTDPLIIPLITFDGSGSSAGQLEVTIQYHDTFPGFFAFLKGGIEIRFVMALEKHPIGEDEGTQEFIRNEAMEIFKDYDSEIRKTGVPFNTYQFLYERFEVALGLLETYAARSIAEGKPVYYVLLWLTFNAFQHKLSYDDVKKASRYPISVIWVGVNMLKGVVKCMDEMIEREEKETSILNPFGDNSIPRSILTGVEYELAGDIQRYKKGFGKATRSAIHDQFLAYMMLNNVKVVSKED